MAYLLRFGQSGRSVDFATPITAPTSSFSLEYTAAITNTSQWQSIFFNNESLSTNTAGSFGSQRDAANSRVNVWFTLNGKARVIYTSPTNFTFNAPFTIKIEWSAATSQIRIFQNGTLLTTYSGYNTFNIAPINGISRNSFEGDLYAFKIVRDGVTYDWNTSASNGQGTSLIDTASGNNGVIVGGATYVFYNSVTTTGIPNNTLGAALNQPCQINLNNYFTGATSYAIQSGSLPTGLSISGNQIVGTPTSAESTTLVIRASNSIDLLDSETITFNTGLWLLRFPTSADSRITLPTPITAPATQFKLELDFVFNATAEIASYLHSNTGSSFDNGTLRIDKDASNALLVIITLDGKSRVITTVTGAVIDTRLLLTIEWDSTSKNIVIKRDATTISTLTSYNTFNIAAINAISTNLNSAPFDLYSLKVTSNGALIRNYDPNTSGGVGSLLIDRVSNQNGTQVGTWPADDGEWVSYSSGASDVDLAAMLSSASTLSASLTVVNRMSASLASSSAVSATLTAKHKLSASLQSVSNISASLTLTNTAVVFPIDVSGIPDGTYPVALFNHETGDFVSRTNVAFVSGFAEVASALPVGTQFSGYVIETGATPSVGAVVYGQAAYAS